MITINPLELYNPEHSALLGALLTTDEIGWSKGRAYAVGEQDIYLTHDIYRTNRQQDNASYYVLSNDILGSGLSADVALIECVLSFDAGKVVASEYNTLVAKIHYPIPVDSEEKYQKIYRGYDRQYQLNTRLPHIGMEPPIYLDLIDESEDGKPQYEIVAIFILKKMEGEELFSYLLRSYEGKEELSTQDRLTISRVLLKTFNEQFVKGKILHRDLKVENIYLYFDAQCDIQLNIFDVANLSQEYGTCITKVGGTVGYIAPEARIIGTKITDEKIDMFAMGVTLQTIWGFGNPVLPRDKLGCEKKIEETIRRFFKTDPMAADILRLVYKAILQMTDPDPKSRLSIKQAIQSFEYITIVAAERATLPVTPSPLTTPDSPARTPISWFDFAAKNRIHDEMSQRGFSPASRSPRFFTPVNLFTPVNPELDQIGDDATLRRSVISQNGM